MATWTRGWLGYFFDRVVGRQFGLPAETCNYKVEEMRIPIGEGTLRFELAASLFCPDLAKDAKPLGTILVRCPYGRALPISLGPRLFAARGYQVLVVSCRGTFGSGGDFDPFRNEVEDGKATVEWMRTQDWYTGSFATFGGSYLGFTQWALLVDPPKDMVAAIISVGPHDFGQTLWGTGALNLDIVGWADTVAHQEEPGFFWRVLTKSKQLDPVFSSTPLAPAVKAWFGALVPWVNTMVAKSDVKDQYYIPMDLSAALENANIPILLQAGWYDLFIKQNMEQYLHLSKRGADVSLTVGPWTHVGIGMTALTNQQTLKWFEKYLAGREVTHERRLYQYYVTGAEEWHEVSKYPPPTRDYALYLHPGGKLSNSEPEDVGGLQKSSDFTFDPLNSTPTIGGTLLKPGASGMKNDNALSSRKDVLVFDSDPLQQNVEFCGQVVADFIHTSDSPYADLFVRVSEVDEKGKSWNICETYRRLDPDRKSDTVRLQLDHRAHRFLKGKKIRLIVAGGSHPHFAKNIGTANPDHAGSDVKSVKHTIHHGDACSKITLPVVAE